MDSIVVEQGANEIAPFKGDIIALSVDSTGRAYSLAGLSLGGFTPDGSNVRPSHVFLYLQAQTSDVFVQFAGDNTVTLDNTAVIAVGGTLAFGNTYCVYVPAGATVKCRISRKRATYLHVKTASAGATLRMWAPSEGAA